MSDDRGELPECKRDSNNQKTTRVSLRTKDGKYMSWSNESVIMITAVTFIVTWTWVRNSGEPATNARREWRVVCVVPSNRKVTVAQTTKKVDAGSERKVSKCMVYCSSCEEEANKFEMLTWPLNSSDLSTPSEVQWSLYLSGSGLFVSNNTSAPIRSAEDWSNYKPRGWDVGTLHIVYYVYVGPTLWNTRHKTWTQ